MARKIVIAVHKGGVGKTTSAKNLAAALALMGKRTLLIDLDEQANATVGMGVDPNSLEKTLNDLFIDPNLDPQAVLVATGVDNLHLLPAHSSLSNTETGMAMQRADPNAPDPIFTLKAIIEPLESLYDYMVFDTPPSLNYMTYNALTAADELIIPAAASAYSEKGVETTWNAYEQVKARHNPGLERARVLVTRVKRTNASTEVLSGLKDKHAEAVIPQLIAESTAVDEAEQTFQTVVTYDRSNPAAEGYIEVARIIENGR